MRAMSDLEETMQFDPEDGIADLDTHLDRLKNAAEEISFWRDYRYTIVSGSVEEDLQKFRAIMRAERYLSRRMAMAESGERQM